MKLTRKERVLALSLAKLAKDVLRPNRSWNKASIRKCHLQKRLSGLASLDGTFESQLALLKENLASPSDITLQDISPELVTVESDTHDSRLFAAATLLWSVPVSRGFGRRIRYVVRDRQNDKLMGIIGLTDPVFNLSPRDLWVGWSSRDREKRLIHAMDGFVLGALPPYNRILGGKLIALLSGSTEVVQAFRAKYRAYESIISRRRKRPQLALLTTSSALGRSSVYNRLKLAGGIEFLSGIEKERVPSWYTRGFGHFHIPDAMFAEMEKVLARRGHPYAQGNRFGDGPNWRIRVIRQACKELGVDRALLQHGIRRQVFVIPLATNTREFLLGEDSELLYKTSTVSETTQFWLKRWAVPRDERCPEWRMWNSGGTVSTLRRLRAYVSGEAKK